MNNIEELMEEYFDMDSFEDAIADEIGEIIMDECQEINFHDLVSDVVAERRRAIRDECYDYARQHISSVIDDILYNRR